MYGGTEPSQPVLDDIKDLSGGGATPISSLTIAGHVGHTSTTISGDNTSLDIGSLPKDAALALSEANQKRGPRRCWFTRKASVRFVGCTSADLAATFAKSFLRKNAQAFGTTNWLCAGWLGKTSAGDPYIFGSPPPLQKSQACVEGISNEDCNAPKPLTPALTTPAAVVAANIWKTLAGSL
jgi:hypothetical protein